MSKRYKKFLTTIGSMSLLAVIFDIFPTLMRSIDYFLQSKQLNVGTVLMLMVPLIMIINGLSKEKEKRKRSLHIQMTQQRMERNQKKIMDHWGIEGEWSSPINGSEIIRTHISITPYTLLRTVRNRLNQRRMSMLTNILKANLSKKLISALVSIGVVSLNNKFNLNLSENTVDLILGLSLAHISLQTIIDSIKAWATSKLSAENIQKTLSPIANMTFQEAIPYLEKIRDDFNDFLIHARLDDGSDKFQLAMKAFADIEVAFKSYKIPEPLAVIVEDKVAS